MRSRSFQLAVACLTAVLASSAAFAQAPSASCDQQPAIDIPSNPPGGLPKTGTPNADNAAGLSIDLSPGDVVSAGSAISFRVSTRKPGYLILVDVDATGKLSQIYPNGLSMLETGGVKDDANFIKDGKSITIPDKASKSSFMFVACPPRGTEMVVALLSDKPMQIVDLPDVPTELVGQPKALDFLVAAIKELKIMPANDVDPMEQPTWSLAPRFYTIK